MLFEGDIVKLVTTKYNDLPDNPSCFRAGTVIIARNDCNLFLVEWYKEWSDEEKLRNVYREEDLDLVQKFEPFSGKMEYFLDKELSSI